MFSSDSNRVIPRQRSKLGNLIILPFLLYGSVSLFFFLFFVGGEDTNTTTRITDLVILFVIFFIVFSIFFNLILFADRWFKFQRWIIFAEERGLPVEKKSWFSTPVIQGTYRGYQISIADSCESLGHRGKHFTNFMMTLNTPTKSTFAIKKRGITRANRELTRDEEVDKKLTVEINSKILLQQILKTRRVRQGLLELGERASTRALYLNGKILHYKESDLVSTSEYIEAVLNYMIDMINLIRRVERDGW